MVKNNSEKQKYFYIPTSIILLLIVSYFDLLLGHEISFGLFYLIPMLIVTWNINYIWGLIFSIISIILWFSVDKISGNVYSHYLMPYWNAFVRFGFFIIITLSTYKIKELLKKEKSISKLNSDILSAVSHEFNNLLVGINLTAVLLKEDEGKNIKVERLKLYNMHHQNYSAMKEQIKIFLNKARLDSGKIKPFLQRLELRHLVDNTINLLLPLSIEKNLNIIKDFPTNIIPVKCDTDLISLAVSNLIANAIKYSPKDENIYISIRQVDENTTEISIKDNGIGVDRKDFENIFSGFFRTNTGMDQAKGFGIGLKLTKDILELHNSTLKLESAQGKGSRFYFNLPIYKNIN